MHIVIRRHLETRGVEWSTVVCSTIHWVVRKLDSERALTAVAKGCDRSRFLLDACLVLPGHSQDSVPIRVFG